MPEREPEGKLFGLWEENKSDRKEADYEIFRNAV